MKALTLTQPWATLVAIGAKRIESGAAADPYWRRRRPPKMTPDELAMVRRALAYRPPRQPVEPSRLWSEWELGYLRDAPEQCFRAASALSQSTPHLRQ